MSPLFRRSYIGSTSLQRRNGYEARKGARCTHKTPSGFRASTTISPIRLELLGGMVAQLAQGYAPRPQRSAELTILRQAEYRPKTHITQLSEEVDIIQHIVYLTDLHVSNTSKIFAQ